MGEGGGGGTRRGARGERGEVFPWLTGCFSSGGGTGRFSPSVREARGGGGGGGTLDEFVFLDKYAVLVFAFEVLDTFNCTIVFTWREDYKRLQSSLLTKNRILTVWTIEGHTHPFSSSKFSFTNIFDSSHSKYTTHLHHNLQNKEESGYSENPIIY